MSILLYRFIENIDGERDLKLISYVLGQRIKMFLLTYFIK
jgi:hypothetical protein